MPRVKRVASTPAAAPARPKRTKTAVDEDPVVVAGKAALKLFDDILAEDPEVRADRTHYLSDPETTDLAAYTHHLERALAAALATASGEPAELAPEELAEKTKQLRGLIARGIQNLLKWKPSCKTNTAAFSFEGICADPRVMANMLGVEDATKFKVKKYTVTELEENILKRMVEGSTRYASLYLNGNVNLKWNHETGEYKWTGKYGLCP